MDIKKHVHLFLDAHLDPKKPILLAFSGGPDSSVLLDLLLEYRCKVPFELHLAHVDHGWRPESAAEAEAMQAMALRLQLPFHLKTLNVKELSGNLEDACRQERLAFFSTLSSQFGFQAVLLGHHRDDQAETVLKRILEGASLANLRGITALAKHGGMHLLRPLLEIPKVEIIAWAEKKGLNYLLDSTNSDLTFLRARMRQRILPALAAEFGKNVSEPLARLGLEAEELQKYLSDKTEKLWSKLVRTERGLFLDLQEEAGHLYKLEVKFLLRQIAQTLGQSLTTPVLDAICEALLSGVSGHSNAFAGSYWIADRSRLFVISSCLEEELPPPIVLKEGVHRYGCWQVEVSQKRGEACQPSSWRECFAGEAQAFLPMGEYQLGAPQLSLPIHGKMLSKWFTAHQVPVFMRNQMPVVWQDKKIVYEFLTGSPKQAIQENGVHLLCRAMPM